MLELKDKFTATAPDGSYLDTDAQSPTVAQGTRGEAISALVALGYSRGEASSALSSVTEKDLTTEEYIKRALKNLF